MGNGLAVARRSRATSRGAARIRRHLRVRKKITGTTDRPRLVVTRSARHLFAQVVDDTTGHTLVSASTMEPDIRSAEGDKTARSRLVGTALARRAQERDIASVVFDRAGYRYHGRIAALADAARESGLKF